MGRVSREFQVFLKPIGSLCNLNCHYCYYLEKEYLYPREESLRMPVDILEEYIVQHIEASSGQEIRFSWHGGEPTLLGLDYFKTITELQRHHEPPGRRITNGLQTNGTLLNDDWCRFFASEGFAVGLSLDGPPEIHDRYRLTKAQQPTHKLALRGYNLLQQHGVPCDILCVVHAENAQDPLSVYRFFKEIKAQYIGFLPLVERQPGEEKGVSRRTPSARDLGNFFSIIFDEWKTQDIGQIVVQNFEEVARVALGREHALCVFRQTCGDCPAVEHNGDFFACDHFVDLEHRWGNIGHTPLAELLESHEQRAFGQAKWDSLPRYCLECEVLEMCHGGCPKDRFLKTPDGEQGLNYLCEGYRHFFNHCRPFVTALQTLQERPSIARTVTTTPPQVNPASGKIGRNDPCPCGSGKKYKKCCLGK